MLADVIIVDSDPLQDVRVLNNRKMLSTVISKGKEVDLTQDWPERAVFPGEKVGVWSTRPLTQDVANELK